VKTKSSVQRSWRKGDDVDIWENKFAVHAIIDFVIVKAVNSMCDIVSQSLL